MITKDDISRYVWLEDEEPGEAPELADGVLEECAFKVAETLLRLRDTNADVAQALGDYELKEMPVLAIEQMVENDVPNEVLLSISDETKQLILADILSRWGQS